MSYVKYPLPMLGALVLMLALAACSVPGAGPTVDLDGTDWSLVSLNGADPAPGTHISLSFDDGNAGGYSGCNSYGGAYTTAGARIEMPELAMTLMACSEPEGVMEQETAYLAALGNAAAYRVDGDRLELDDDTGTTLLVFERQEPVVMNPAELIGTAWQLDSIDGSPAAGHFSLRFDSATALSGQTPCRDFEAAYQADADNFGLTFMEMKALACLQPESLLVQEGDYTTRVGAANGYRLDGDRLELLTMRGESLVFSPLAAGASRPDTTWYLVSMFDGSVAIPPLDGSQITLEAGDGQVLENGVFAGSAGCNSYSASYTYDGSQFSFGPVVMTRMACDEPDGVMQQEQQFAAWLEDVIHFRFDADQLRLETADGRALLFALSPIAPAGPAFVAPPLATLNVAGSSQQAGLGSYCWTTQGSEGIGPGMCADTMGIITPPDALVVGGSPFVASFDLPLDATPSDVLLRVMLVDDATQVADGDGWRAWHPGTPQEFSLPLERAPEIELTLEPGLYVFSIFARWDGYGDVTYGWLVEVE